MDKSARASYGQPLGTNGWFLDALPSWTLGHAGFALASISTPEDQRPADWPTWANGWYDQWLRDRPELAGDIAEAFKTDFADLFPQEWWEQYSYTVDVDALKRGDWLNISTSAGYPSPWSIGGDPGHKIHGEFTTIDQDLEAKGFELEVNVRPTDNWDVTFNVSKATAEQTGLGATAGNYLNDLAELFLKGPLGQVANWGTYTEYGEMKKVFLQNLWAPYLQQIALTGSDQPEWRKLKFNFVTNYSFKEGAFKGFSVGGAYRWQDKAIMGYGIHETEVFGESAWITDVNQPIYGPDEAHMDLWAGYEHALNDDVTWKLQLNVKNVGESEGLTPISYQPTGEIAQQRIQTGAEYNLSMKFSF